MGMDPEEFWNHSPNEIADIIYALDERAKVEERRRIDKIFVLAEVMTRYLFPDKKKKEAPHPWEYYPELFKEEKKRYIEKATGEAAQADFKEKRKAYYKRFNEEHRK